MIAGDRFTFEKNIIVADLSLCARLLSTSYLYYFHSFLLSLFFSFLFFPYFFSLLFTFFRLRAASSELQLIESSIAQAHRALQEERESAVRDLGLLGQAKQTIQSQVSVAWVRVVGPLIVDVISQWILR